MPLRVSDCTSNSNALRTISCFVLSFVSLRAFRNNSSSSTMLVLPITIYFTIYENHVQLPEFSHCCDRHASHPPYKLRRSNSTISPARCTHNTARGYTLWPHLKLNSSRALQISDNLKELASCWISIGTKHLMQSLRVNAGLRSQIGEANGGVNIVTQQFLAE